MNVQITIVRKLAADSEPLKNESTYINMYIYTILYFLYHVYSTYIHIYYVIFVWRTIRGARVGLNLGPNVNINMELSILACRDQCPRGPTKRYNSKPLE